MAVTQEQVEEWRRKILASEDTIDDLRDIVNYLRESRVGASIASAQAKNRVAAKPGKSTKLAADLLGSLDNFTLPD